MSVITRMRRWSKFLFILVAVVFVLGFLLGELWQILGRRGSENMLAKGIVGKVGKKNITLQEYQNTFDYLAAKHKVENNVQELSKQDMERISQQTWQYVTEQKNWADILKRNKITVTDPELIEIIKANPPQDLRMREDFMTNGEFDYQKYQEYIFAPENRLRLTLYAYELSVGLPREKFRLDVVNSYRVTSNEINDAKIKENTALKVSYLLITSKVLQEQYKPSEAEIKSYYEKNKKKYEQDKRYRVRYVFFPLTITKRDSLEVERLMQDIYQYTRNEEFTNLIREFSDFPTDTIARWFKIKEMDIPTQNALAELKNDSITPPFLTSFWQIIKVDKKIKDSVLVRKIIKRIEVSRETEYALRDSIDNFLNQAHSIDFDTLCQSYGLALRELPPWTKERINFPSLYNQSPLKEFILKSKPKAISPAYKGRGGYFVFQLMAVEPKQIQPLEQVKSSIEWQIRRDKEKDLVKAYAEQIMDKVRQGISLEEIAQTDSLIEFHTEEFNSFRECRNRKGSQFAGTAYALNPGEIFGVLATEIGSFIVRCDERRENQVFDELIFQENRKTEVGNRIFQHVIKQPEIVDYRSADFFQYY
ncbi:MAG: peptidyl-prolyl cis-trans isomerase [candidate division WOR-3 bacterium]